MNQVHSELTKNKLKEAKPLIKLFGLDYDGTVSDAEYKIPEVSVLVEKILDKNKSVAFVTGSAASILKKMVSPLQKLLNRDEIIASVFIAGGNGTTLYEVKKNELIEIYNHGFDLPYVLKAVEVGRNVYKELSIGPADLSEKGLETFKKFLQEDWEGYIPGEIIDVCRPFNGELFTEQAKVTFVLPKNKLLHQKLVDELNKQLGEEYQAVAGDEAFVHITRKLNEDSKAAAVKSILEILSLKQNQVATFGNMPTGNDVGLLSFPYSFTNSEEFADVKKDLEQPPYILSELDLPPVARVYKAIEYLIS